MKAHLRPNQGSLQWVDTVAIVQKLYERTVRNIPVRVTIDKCI